MWNDHCGALPPDGHNDEQCDTEHQGAEPRTGAEAVSITRTMNTTYSARVPSTSASQRR